MRTKALSRRGLSALVIFALVALLFVLWGPYTETVSDTMWRGDKSEPRAFYDSTFGVLGYMKRVTAVYYVSPTPGEERHVTHTSYNPQALAGTTVGTLAALLSAFALLRRLRRRAT